MSTTLSFSRPARIAAAAVVSALVLAACGGGDDPTISGSGSGSGAGSSDVAASPVPGIDSEHNDADIAFITDMTPHHEGAIDMAELAETRAQSSEVRALAVKIVAAQDPEIETMKKMTTAWGVDLSASGAEHGGGHSSSMGDGDVAALEPLSGAEFEREFLTRMTAHHEGAVEMAETELADGLNAQAKEMAADIVQSQTAEIARMKTLLAAL